MGSEPSLFDKILDFFQNATMERILLLVGVAFVIFGVVGQVEGLGTVLAGFEWVLIILGVILMAASVSLYLRSEGDKQSAAYVIIGGVIIAAILAAIFLSSPSALPVTPMPSPTDKPTATVTQQPALTAMFTATVWPSATAVPPTATATAMAVPPTPSSTATSTPTPTPRSTQTPVPPTPTATPILHTIVNGDILTCVSLHYYWTPVRWNAICQSNKLDLNPIGSCGPLNIGDALEIPPTYIPDDWFWASNSPNSLDATCPIYPTQLDGTPTQESPTLTPTATHTATPLPTASFTPLPTDTPEATDTAVPSATPTP